MIIEITYKVEQKKKIEVEFPLYISASDSFDSGGWYETEMRITLEVGCIRVQKIQESDGGKWEFEIERVNVDHLSSYLGKDQHYYSPSTTENYHKHLSNMLKEAERLDHL